MVRLGECCDPLRARDAADKPDVRPDVLHSASREEHLELPRRRDAVRMLALSSPRAASEGSMSILQPGQFPGSHAFTGADSCHMIEG
jgi:hypothetical protein